MLKNLDQIQPISNLQNYTKTILPVLKRNQSVYLTKRGKGVSVILTADDIAKIRKLLDYYKKELATYFKNADKTPGYSINEAKRIVSKK